MSTTGIAAMVVIFFAYSIKGNMSLMKKTIVASVLLACLPTILSLDFMSDKIGEEMGSDATYSRFGAIAYHMTQIEQSPFLGFGPFLSTVLVEIWLLVLMVCLIQLDFWYSCGYIYMVLVVSRY